MVRPFDLLQSYPARHRCQASDQAEHPDHHRVALGAAGCRVCSRAHGRPASRGGPRGPRSPALTTRGGGGRPWTGSTDAVPAAWTLLHTTRATPRTRSSHPASTKHSRHDRLPVTAHFSSGAALTPEPARATATSTGGWIT